MPLRIEPESITLTGNESVTFKATKDGSPVSEDARLSWAIHPNKGTIDKGIYTAPGFIPISKRVAVQASLDNESAEASVLLSASHTWIMALWIYWVAVMIGLGWGIHRNWKQFDLSVDPDTLVVGPAVVTLMPGDSQQFLAAGGEVDWGDLKGGHYAAPVVEGAPAQQPGRVFAIKRKQGNGGVADTVAVLHSDKSLSINPPVATLRPGETLRFEVTKAADDLQVEWLVPEAGKITANGSAATYEAPAAVICPRKISLIARAKGETSGIVAAARIALVPLPGSGGGLAWMAVFFGALGAAVHGVNSLVAYVGNRQFLSSWGLYYLARPFIGGILAVLVFVVFRGNLVSNVAAPRMSDLYAVAALSGLVGLFSDKTLLKLEQILDAVLGGRPDARADRLARGEGSAAPKIEALEPKEVKAGSASAVIAIRGTGFDAGAKARVDGKERALMIESRTLARLMLTAEDVAKAGDLKIAVVSASGSASEEMTLKVA